MSWSGAAADQFHRPGHGRRARFFAARPQPGRVAGLAGGDRAEQSALITQLERLFESFVNLINLAIDEKSPYTGGHCERVPALTMMLAEAAHATTDGPLAAFVMTERDRYELKMAGPLHDCGKITTLVHVVDKATKLQTIFDRIGLVDTRFEVLKRDAEIDMLRRQLALRRGRMVDAAAEARLQDGFQDQRQQLDEERAFLRRCNLGSEAMRPEDQARVQTIGSAHRWRNAEGWVEDFCPTTRWRT